MADTTRKVGRGVGQRTVTEYIAAQNHFQPQDAIWQAVRKLKGKQFMLADVCSQLLKDGASGVNDTTIESYLQRLTRGGYLRVGKSVVNRGFGAMALHYELDRDTGNETPRLRDDGTPSQRGTANDRMWRSMKVLKEFTHVDLQASASSADREIKTTSVKSYLRHLLAAGYLSITKSSKPGTPARYRLLPSKITGPRAPMVQRTHRVFDPNLKKIVWREDQ